MKKKEIKDAYPKKVCHMPTRHVKKRCIPEEGMPHAHKACQKKREEEEKDSPYPRKKNGGQRGIVQMSSSTIHQTKIIHTPAHLDQGL